MRTSTTSSNPVAPRPRLPTTNSSLPSDGPKPSTHNVSSEKRKAETQLPRFQDKSLKPDTTSTASAVADRLERAARSGKPDIPTSKTSRFGPPRQNGSQVQPPAAALSASKAPPKKGSFAEIMARAESARKAAAAAPLGAIKHKPKEKLGVKKEILMSKKGIPIRGKDEDKSKIAARATGNASALGNGEGANGKLKSKSAPTIGYSGTAKPKPSYKGTMKPDVNPKSLHRKDKFVVSDESDDSRSRFKKPLSSKARDLDSEDEEAYGLDDDEDIYSGDESSDMEAGLEDMEEEDKRAAKLAREEDERELRLLDERKKEKEDRKRRMEAMAAKNRRR